MPNTPALIGQGMSGLFACPQVDSAGRTAGGAHHGGHRQFLWVQEETQLDAVTALSGSGPAYVFLLLEAMTEAGTAMGLTPEQSYQLASGHLPGCLSPGRAIARGCRHAAPARHQQGWHHARSHHAHASHASAGTLQSSPRARACARAGAGCRIWRLKPPPGDVALHSLAQPARLSAAQSPVLPRQTGWPPSNGFD